MLKIVFFLYILLVFFSLVSCGKDEVVEEKPSNIETVVPIFEGISLATDTQNVTKKLNNTSPLAVGEENYEELLPDLVEDSNVTYFAQADSNVKVEVHLKNPSQFEILSLTINGRKYQSFEFLEGSTGNLLLINIKAPSLPGEYEYLISDIKYIDGQDIKDVNMSNGNKNVKFGVTYTSLPTLTVYDIVTTGNTFSAKTQLIDSENVLAASAGLRCYLFDQNNIIVASAIVTNDMVSVYDLTIGYKYHYVFAVSYDALDGKGAKSYILSEGDIITSSPIYLKNVVTTTNSISFGVASEGSDARLDSLVLIDGETRTNIKSDNVGNITINNLLANHSYSIEYSFTYASKFYTLKEEVKTLAHVAPEIVAFTADATKKSISYDYNILDTDNLVKEIKVTLYKDGIVVKTNDNNISKEFTDLFSNTTYQIELAITYNLEDGNGDITDTILKEVKTLSLLPPLISISYTISDDTFKGVANIVDNDEIYRFDHYELCNQIGEVIATSTDINYISNLANLKRNTNYQLKLIYSYDLNTGSGEQLGTYVLDFSTTKMIPELSFSTFYIASTAFGIDISETDPNIIGEIANIRLFDANNNYLKQISVTNSFEFTNLKPNTKYIYKVYYNYDLDDGNGSQEVVYEQEIITAKQEPQVDFNLSSTKTTIVVSPVISDLDMSGSITNISLYYGDSLVKEGLNAKFTGLLSNNIYTIVLTYTYNLNDLKGEQIKIVSKEVKTLAKVAPTIEFSIKTVDYSSLTLNYTLVDEDNIFTFVSGVLYLNNKEMKALTLDNLSSSSLYSNNLYNFVCTYTYDLNDGRGLQVGTATLEVRTAKYNISLTYKDLSCTEDSIFFDYNIIDDSNTLAITKIELLDMQGQVVQTLSDLEMREFKGLSASEFYKIVTTYTYNTNDGSGKLTTDQVTQEYGTSGAKVNVLGFEVINSDSLLVGKEIHIRVSLDNPHNLALTALYINDIRFTAEQFGVDGDSIIIRFTPETLGGSYNVVLTGYSYTITSSSGEIELKENLFTDYVDAVYILGDLGVTYFGSSRDLPFVVKGQKEISLKFDGTKGYQIESIETTQRKYSKEEIEVISDSEVRISSNDNSSAITLRNIQYSLEGQSTIQSYDITANLYVVDSAEILPINEASDFANLENYRVYEITNDIDFSMVNGNLFNKEFVGVIIGNNHKLLNFSLQSRLATNNNELFGLFSTFTGYVENITFVNPYVIIEDIETVYVGVMAGSLNQAVINNVTVENVVLESSFAAGGLIGRSLGGSTLTNIAITGRVSGKGSVGGVMGIDGKGDNITKALNKANISGNSYVGGIVGYAISDITINEAVNYGTITGVEEQVGGIIGGTTGDVSISNAINYGMVTGYLYVGGIVGFVNGAGNKDSLLGDKLLNFATTSGQGIIGTINTVAYLSNCLSSNSFTDYNIQAEQITNCYTLAEEYVEEDKNIRLATSEQIKTKEFWLSLGFDEAIWDLDDLTNYPTLKFAVNFSNI